MKFESKKGLLAAILIGGISILSLGLTYVLLLHKDNVKWLALITVLPALFLLWTWFDTSYEIESSIIKIRSGPLRSPIKIQDIHTIIVGETLSSGFRPALSMNGCIIRYERWNEIYISPENLDLFNEELLKINPTILLS
jgi:hypothetical protein